MVTRRPHAPSTALGVAVRITVTLALAVVLLAAANGGPAYFLQLGDESPGLENAQRVLGEDVPTPLKDGHDGDRFWQLARDPLLRDDTSLGTYLDRPVYRAQRIGYPMLAAPWRVIGEGALLWGLVLTNLAIAGIGTYLLSRWAVGRGLSPLVGYLFAAHPLTWLSLIFDLGDAAALGGLMVAVLCFAGGSTALMIGGAVLGALAKETVLLGLGSAALLARGADLHRRVLLVAPAALAAGLWRVYLLSRPGLGDDPQVEEFVVVPFLGYWDSLRRGWVPQGMWVQATLSLALLAAAVWCVVLWLCDRRSLLLSAALPYALMAPFLSVQVVSLWINVVRALAPAPFFGALYLVDRRGRGAEPLSVASTVTSS